MNIIAYDIDDVTFECYKVLYRYLNEKFGYKETFNDHVQFKMTIKGLSNNQLYKEVRKCLNSTLLTPLNNSFDYIIDIYNKSKDSEILFITSRDKKILKEVTETNIKIYLEDIPFTVEYADGRIGKNTYLQKHGVKFFVDDRFKNCNQVSQVTKRTFCVNQPWNMGREFKYDNITRIDSLKDLSQDFILNCSKYI